MSNVLRKVEAKLGDHPNVTDDDGANPKSGVGIGANQGDVCCLSACEALDIGLIVGAGPGEIVGRE